VLVGGVGGGGGLSSGGLNQHHEARVISPISQGVFMAIMR